MSLIKSIGGKNVNFDFNKEFLSIFSDKIKASDIKFINQTLADLHPSDVANLIENLSSETRAKLLEIEEFGIDPEIFVEINESIQTEILQLLSSEAIAKIIKRLEGSQDQKEESKRICVELIEAFRNINGVKGVHLMGHKKEQVISEIINESKK